VFLLPGGVLTLIGIRLLGPAVVRLDRSLSLDPSCEGAGFTQVMLRKLANGGFAIVRGVAAA
jgi:hypothetical protein